MQTLIFATNNKHKVDEINVITSGRYHVISLKEAGVDIDVPEPYLTLEENARTKSKTIYALTGRDCFSEDTGLEVEALNGEPGVKSARYAGEGRSMEENISKLLVSLAGSVNRKAQFRTVISLVHAGAEYQFEGVCTGSITHSPKGEKGFGYDSVFIPDGGEKTFAEMDIQEKNLYSHRKKAVKLLLDWLSHDWKKTSQF